MIDPIDTLTGAHEANLEAAISAAIDDLFATFDVPTIAAILADARRTDALPQPEDHERLLSALGISPTADPITDAFDQSAPIVGGLASFFAAVAALAAAQARHTISATDTGMISARDRAIQTFCTGYTLESVQALREAVDHMINASGDPVSRALQLRRTIGLSVNQADSLRAMRGALMAYATASTKTTRARTINGVRMQPQIFRDIDTSAILRRLNGRLSAPQLNLVRKAFADNIDPDEAERRLDRHAKAMRTYRNKVAAGDAVHGLAETAKLTGWQIAQRFGSLPHDQRQFWVTAGDERVRFAHALVPGMNPQGVALHEPFATPLGGRFAPPLEYGCRCKATLRAMP